mgnify:CR=1 FL=1
MIQKCSKRFLVRPAEGADRAGACRPPRCRPFDGAGPQNDKILHSVFHELPHYLEKGDLLVVNNSKVLPARLMGTKVPTGAVCELLLLRQVKGDTWECLARPGKRMQPGTKWSSATAA